MAGAGSLPVARRLHAALTDLRAVAPSDRVRSIDNQLDLLASAVKSAMDDERDVHFALREDREEIGVAVSAH
jgi:hypothetical protein